MTKLCSVAYLILVVSFTGCVLEGPFLPEMVSTSQSRPVGDEKSLDASVQFGIGTLEISAESASNLYSMDLDYDKAHYQPEVQYDPALGDVARLSIKLIENHKIRGARTEQNRLRLGFSDSVPLKLRINTGVGKARYSLTRLKLARLELDSGVGGANISAYDENPIECERIRIRNGVGAFQAVGLGNLNFRELDFEGGVGGADLDFTGKWKHNAEIRVQVGVGGVALRMPRDIGVEVEAERHFLSGIHLDGFSKRNARYYSENYDKSKIRVTLRVATGIGGLKITWV